MKNPIFILAAIFTVLIFSGISSAQPDPPKEKMKPRGDMMEKLNLTDSQKDKLKEFRMTQEKEMIDLKAQLKKDQLSLKEIRSKDNFSRSEIISTVEKINQSKNKIALKIANNRMDMYEVLTPEQQKIWKENAKHFGGKEKFKHRKRMMKERDEEMEQD
ncbi:MAG: Spy/CpxP family protein refolding chaperone [Ignavibacteriaceae bacterium]